MRIGAIAFATLPAVTPAFAGDPLPGEDVTRLPVRDRPRPDYDPVGWRYGAIFFYPWLLTETRYNSNVFARPTDPQADLFVVFSPRLTVRSDSPRLSWRADFGADVYRYRRLTSQNRTDAHARFRAHGEIRHDLDFDAGFQAAQRHELPGDPSAPLDAAQPVPFLDIRGDAALTQHFGAAGITAGAGARSLTYGTVPTLSGAPLDQSWRDATIVTSFARPFYEFAPGYRAFLYGRVNAREYQGRTGVNLDSRGYDVRGGLDFVVTSLISGTIEAGWLKQTFSDPGIPDADGLSFAGKLTWLITPLTTITLRGERVLAERTSPEFPARIDAFATAQVDHELSAQCPALCGCAPRPAGLSRHATPGRGGQCIRRHRLPAEPVSAPRRALRVHRPRLDPAAVQLRPAPGDAQCYSAVLSIAPRSTASRSSRPSRRSRRSASSTPC